MQLLGGELHLEIAPIAEHSSLLNTSEGNHEQSTPCNVSAEGWKITAASVLGWVRQYLQTYLWQMIRSQC